MQFINLPRGRRLVPIPSISWSGTFNAGYDESLGAKAVEIPYEEGELSLVLVLPGKISEFLVGGLDKIEDKIDNKSWENILKSFVSRNLELQVPVFDSHSVLDLNETLISLGLQDSFSDKADFSGINGAWDLKMSSFLQVNEMSIEIPASSRAKREGRRKGRVDKVISLLAKRYRQNETYQLYFERQFMYLVRHNPTGLILYIGRYHHPPPHHHHGDHHEHSHSNQR